jgi:hypothetical protein
MVNIGYHHTFRSTFREILTSLGKNGRRVLEKWDAEKRKGRST